MMKQWNDKFGSCDDKKCLEKIYNLCDQLLENLLYC